MHLPAGIKKHVVSELVLVRCKKEEQKKTMLQNPMCKTGSAMQQAEKRNCGRAVTAVVKCLERKMN